MSSILAVIGNESHTTSRGWSNLYINGKRVNHRDALSTDWLTKYGDKHASWVECLFAVKDGDEITWEAGANSGSRGSDRTRINRTYIFDSSVDVVELEGPGYPAREAKLEGRLVLKVDEEKEAKVNHNTLKNSL